MSADPVMLLTDSLVADLARGHPQTGWRLSLCVDAREAGGCFLSALQPAHVGRIVGPAADPKRAADEAARPARAKSRRYCAANRLNRLGTLTYRGAGCHDPKVLGGDVALFFRTLRGSLGGDPFPYLWTSEWHKSGHGLHLHFAAGRFIKRGLIEQAWQHGFVHIKLLGDLPVGSGTVAEARQAARYLSKYVGKDFDTKRAGVCIATRSPRGSSPRSRPYGVCRVTRQSTWPAR